MKKLCAFLVCFIILSSNVAASSAKFNDIEEHWAKDVIEKWQDYGYINGYPDGSFKPDNPVTRGELAKILSSAFDLKECQVPEYSDVSEGDWYYPYLEKSGQYIPVYPLVTLYESNMPYHENELQGGKGFLPSVNALRMHVAEALVEVKMQKENIVIEDLSIQDINAQVQAVFKDEHYLSLDAMHGIVPKNVERMNRYTWLAHKLNIMIGDDGYFYPYGYITRAELLTAIDRMTN